ncbi:MAG TPA: AAA family ATPase [Pyrinomonadaceae bacterium]|jgi:ATP-dependent Clp protease ATP-binding subunit ClpA
MLISIPVLATEYKQSNQPAPTVYVRPLFALRPVEQAASLQRALGKLAQSLREVLMNLGAEARHDEIANFTFSPYLSQNFLNFRLFLSNQSFDCKYLFVTFDAFGKKIAYTPNVPDFWFEMERGEDLQRRAEDALEEHFKTLERRDGKGSQNPSALSFTSKAFVTTLDFNLPLPQKFEKQEVNLFAMLGGDEKLDGDAELRRVGRCLDWLYPDELERAVGRAPSAKELTQLLGAKDRRPVVVIGKNQVGKTNLIHEYVFGKIKNRPNAPSHENQTWLVSPQRLISGMSFVGQWENRLTAILKEVAERRHLLYFDDLLGLFFAGVSASSDLSVAQVLKPYIERREVRVVGEITPETWRVLKEKDRSFAELFHVFRLAETDADETLRIVLSVRRELEYKFNCRFELDALPTALDLQRRYNREAHFPGKAASFLKQIANKFQDAQLKRDDVLREFEAKSGMRVAFLDDKSKLERAEITRRIADGVIGQKAAVESAADVISIAKARLNETTRPIASFLFLGATGVGKTEAAKQIAAYLYGSEEKLLRFDMNEFVSSFDVARLVGTFDQPEGILTSAIRRQPFSVVLLDEIEKAHADVFNLLLQVLGDGRLTDAHGRTADFSNAIIILTSNLGAREANVKLGFRETNESNASIYRQAAEKFFRPEFFNRLDRIIPFENLRREDVERIARIQLQKVFARDGFQRRNCRLELEPSAVQKIVDEGYHPELGARALKRAIERNLTQPVAARLSALQTTSPTIIKISRADDKFLTEVEEIKLLAAENSVWLTHEFSDIQGELDKIEDVLDRIEDEIEPLKPRGEIISNDERQTRYFLVLEYIRRIERMIERADKWNESRAQSPKSGVQKRQLVSLREAGTDFSGFLSSPNLSFRLREMAQENRAFGASAQDYVQDIWRETALLQAVSENLAKPLTTQSVMAFRCSDFTYGNIEIPQMIERYKRFFGQELGLKIAGLNADNIETDYYQKFIALEGMFAFDLAKAERGNHVFVSRRGDFTPIEIEVFELGANQTLADFPQIYMESVQNKRKQDFNVVRIYNERLLALDFRSALATRENLTLRELRTFILSGLKPPQELI